MRRESRIYPLFARRQRGLTWLAGWLIRETIEIRSTHTRPQCRQFKHRDEASNGFAIKRKFRVFKDTSYDRFNVGGTSARRDGAKPIANDCRLEETKICARPLASEIICPAGRAAPVRSPALVR